MIRLARLEDVPVLLDIYSPYIRNTAVSFEYEVPSLEEFRQRFARITREFPWLVWEEDGTTLGYAYGDRAFERAAYAWDADMSIYLAQDARGRGIGTKLYDCLEEMLARLGYHTLYALITGSNEASIRFHEHRGYERQGCLKASGFKLGQWQDMCWYALRVHPVETPEAKPQAFAAQDWALDMMKKYRG